MKRIAEERRREKLEEKRLKWVFLVLVVKLLFFWWEGAGGWGGVDGCLIVDYSYILSVTLIKAFSVKEGLKALFFAYE